MRAENAVSICAKFISYLQILYPLPDKEDNSMKFAIYFAWLLIYGLVLDAKNKRNSVFLWSVTSADIDPHTKPQAFVNAAVDSRYAPLFFIILDLIVLSLNNKNIVRYSQT